MNRPHYRSQDAGQYRKLYSDPRWCGPHGLRKRVLLRDGYVCQWAGCGRSLIGKGNAPNAPVVHHVEDHKGDLELFFDEENCMSTCKECHDRDAQRMTHRGYISGHDVDGRPIDPGHPWNR
ncbi:HNH endonuclease [Tianweitania sp. Rool2]|uniref:HNH endonuclease n=1 Tax=Oryzicola mucosus TaxID=2767425 RepID=A0A8J6PV91_9HYPH|nr:HNH endonuclease [Oryzicola mucosus]